MIVSIDIKPEKNIYYMGSQIIKMLSKSRFKVMSLSQLHDQLNASQEFKISIDSLVLTIDWLFLLGLVKADKNGDIVVCF